MGRRWTYLMALPQSRIKWANATHTHNRTALTDHQQSSLHSLLLLLLLLDDDVAEPTQSLSPVLGHAAPPLVGRPGLYVRQLLAHNSLTRS